MNQLKSDDETNSPDERELIVAYLSYALDDVRAVSDIGLHLLQMTIAALRKEPERGEFEPGSARHFLPLNVSC